MLSHLDLLPLCLEAAGAEVSGDRVLDGLDPLPALTGRGKSPHDRLVFQYGAAFGLREGSWKLVRPGADRPWELYDLASDPGESKNLAPRRPGEVARLDASFQAWLEDAKRDASPPAPRPPREKP